MTTNVMQLTEDIAKNVFHLRSVPGARINKRLRTTAGQYDPFEQIITLNAHLLELNDDNAELIDTIKHELIHYILHMKFGINNCGHTPEFKKMAEKYGVDQYITWDKQYLKKARRAPNRRTYYYKCDHCSEKITTKRQYSRGTYHKCSDGVHGDLKLVDWEMNY